MTLSPLKCFLTTSLQEDNGQETSKEDAAGPKIEADSTTPIREPEKQDKVSL